MDASGGERCGPPLDAPKKNEQKWSHLLERIRILLASDLKVEK